MVNRPHNFGKFPFDTSVTIVLLLILFTSMMSNQSKLRVENSKFYPTLNPLLTAFLPITGDESTPVASQSLDESTLPSTAESEEDLTLSPYMTETVSTPTIQETFTETLPTTFSDLPSETPTLTVSLTATPTSTETPISESVTPSTEDIIWSIDILAPVANQEVNIAGGSESTESQIENEIKIAIEDENITTVVETISTNPTYTTFSISVAGEDGLDQFRQTIFGNLAEQIDVLGGAITLELSGDVIEGESFPLLLESNPSTGFIWKVVNYDPNMINVINDTVFNQKYTLVGSPSIQTIRFAGINTGSTTITLFYGRPWLAEESSNRITVSAGSNLTEEVLDLSAPTQENVQTMGSNLEIVTPEELSQENMTATFDWRSKDGQNWLTPVRNQGPCGSCWAFGTVGVFESAIKIQGGGDVDLSEQYLVSCNNSGYSCSGGWWGHSYHLNRFVSPQVEAGAVLESAFPYSATDGTCSMAYNHPYKLSNWYSIAGDWSIPTVDQIKTTIQTYGPVASAICAGPGFSSYTGGVFSTNEIASCNGSVNHAILLVGWDDATESWILRNSWGPYWGESGYMRIKWGISNVGYAANYVVYTPNNSEPTPGPTPTLAPTPIPSANDSFDTPTSITLQEDFFYSSIQDIGNTSQAFDDPIFPCINARGYKTVWFQYIPMMDGQITVDTIGSNYDTILAIWQGNRGSLSTRGCNDDISYPSNITSHLTNVPVIANQAYYIEVGSYFSVLSGSLTLNQSFKLNPPNDFTASDGSSSTGIDLNWGSVPGATSYKVYRATSLGGIKSQLTSTSETTFADLTTTTGNIYTYWITACMETNCSDFSAPETGYVALPAPVLNASSGTMLDSVLLSWNTINNATDYEIYRADENSNNPANAPLLATVPAVSSASTMSYKDSTAVQGWTYFYWIRTCTYSICGSFNLQAVPGWRQIPVPSEVTASDNSYTDKVSISWYPVSDATSYLIYRSINSTAEKTLIGSNDSLTTTYEDITAIPAIIYTYWVRVCLGEKCSDYGVGDTGSQNLNLPEIFSASDGVSTSKVDLIWSSVNGATSYRIQRATSATGTKTLLTTSTELIYTDTSAVIGTLYTYWITACQGTICSTLTSQDTGYRSPVPPVVTPSKGTILDSILIKWSSINRATGYEIFRSEESIVDPASTILIGKVNKTGKSLSTSFKDTTTIPGKSYFYWVKTCIGAICGTTNTQAASGWRALNIPGSLNATDNSSTESVMITWNTVTGATSYNIYRASSTKGTKTLIGSDLVSSLRYEDTTAIPGINYSYWVTACSGQNCSAFSNHNTGWRSLSIPIGFDASDGTSTSGVSLKWDSVYGAITYKVYRAANSTAGKSLIATTSSTSYTDKKATIGIVYSYWVMACSGKNCSIFSLDESGHRNLTVPTSNATKGTVLDGITISWNRISGATSYEVVRSENSTIDPTSASLVGTILKVGKSVPTSFRDTNTTAGQTLFYWVRACKDSVCGNYSTNTTYGWRGIQPPTGVQPSKGTKADQIIIRWDALSGVDGYQVWRSSSATGTKTQIGGGVITDLQFIDTSLTPGQLQYYWVTACVGDNCSGFGQANTGWLPLGSTALITASDGDFPNKIRITWTGIPGASVYKIFRSTSESGTKSLIKTVATLSFEDTKPAAGTPVYYWIQACRGTVCGPYSSSESGHKGLAKPTSFNASDGNLLDKITLNWRTVSGATSYQIFRSSADNGTRELLEISTSTSYSDTTTSPGVTNYYWIMPCKNSYCGTMSSSNPGWKGLAIPNGLVVVKGSTGNNVNLLWNEVTGATTYKVYRADSLTGTKMLKSSGVNLNLEDTVSLSKTYYYFVQACVGTNCGRLSAAYKYTSPSVP